MLFMALLFVVLLSEGAVGIRNVQLIVPPLVRAGGTATLLCLYDLENAPIYSVKWYRGTHEFFRFMPKENPPIKVFPLAGIKVDIYTSNQHQVTLHNLPTFVSGEISCEITTDSPTVSTACVADTLNVHRLDIDIHVPRIVYSEGEQLVVDCATSTTAKLSFYINNLRVPSEFVKQSYPNRATLNLTLERRHFEPRGDIRLQCSGGISDQYYITTKTISIHRELVHSFALKCLPSMYKMLVFSTILSIFL